MGQLRQQGSFFAGLNGCVRRQGMAYDHAAVGGGARAVVLRARKSGFFLCGFPRVVLRHSRVAPIAVVDARKPHSSHSVPPLARRLHLCCISNKTRSIAGVCVCVCEGHERPCVCLSAALREYGTLAFVLQSICFAEWGFAGVEHDQSRTRGCMYAVCGTWI